MIKKQKTCKDFKKTKMQGDIAENATSKTCRGREAQQQQQQGRPGENE